MDPRRFALMVGIVYLLVGVAGFIPGLVVGQTSGDLTVHAGQGALLGIFPVNVLHHIVHLLVVALGVAAYRSATREPTPAASRSSTACWR